MILFALIVRMSDGLALSASTDGSTDAGPDGQESRKLMKALAKQVGNQEDRCSVKLYTHVIHFVTGYGVTMMALCDPTYPPVLAFSFLNDIQKEFVSVYDPKQITNAVRPYAFIEFDSVIQKARQRYNSPRTLSTRLNLSDLSTELSLRPAKQMVIQDVLPAISKNGPVLPSPGAGGRLPSLTGLHISVLCLNGLLGLLCLYRSLFMLGASTFEEPEGTNPLHGLVFLVEAALSIFQMFLLLQSVLLRRELCLVGLGLRILCTLSAWSLQDWWQSLLQFSAAFLITGCIFQRSPSAKKPNYNV